MHEIAERQLNTKIKWYKDFSTAYLLIEQTNK